MIKRVFSGKFGIFSLLVIIGGLVLLTGAHTQKKEILTIAAAASLKNCLDLAIIPAFQKQYADLDIQVSYDSSGKLQMQIEQGAAVDVFISAATKQVDYLLTKGFVVEGSVKPLLENQLVLIVPTHQHVDFTQFTDLVQAQQLALGEPDSVPAGHYARQSLLHLNIWDQIVDKTSFATNVTEALNWVAEGSADAGIVYSTDAASNQKVRIVATAPVGSLEQIVYPAAIIKNGGNLEQAELFLSFLQSTEAKKLFASYGFVPK